MSSTSSPGISCPGPTWSKPVPMSADDAPPARFPAIGISGRKTFVLGTALGPTGFSESPTSPLIAREVGGGDIGQPAGEFGFLFPVAGTDAEGRLQVVWGESDGSEQSRRARAAGLPRVHSLWSAAFDPRSRAWSPATRLFAASLFPLAWLFRQEAIRPGSGGALTLYTLLPLPDNGEDIRAGRTASTLLRLHHHAERWSVERSFLPGKALTASAADVAGRTVVAYIGPSTRSGVDNSVHVVWSDDERRSWGPAMTISAAALDAPADAIRLLHGDDGTLHLLWRQALASSPAGVVIRHVTSSDRGSHWSSPDDLVPLHRSGGEVHLVDGCGTVHTVFETVGPDAIPHLAHAAWNGRWSALEPLFLDSASFDAALALAPDGRVIMTFTGFRLEDQRVPARSWMTALSR